MKELREHQIYRLLNGRYDRIGCDYVILSSDGPYRGEASHREAVLCAFEVLKDRFSSYGLTVDVDPDKMTAAADSADGLLKLPPDGYSARRKKPDRSRAVPAPIPYWYAFLEPPWGTPYQRADFIAFNEILFPNRDGVDVFRWNDAFSNYFDDGREWWGTGLWSVFDRKTGVFVIIGASLTD